MPLPYAYILLYAGTNIQILAQLLHWHISTNTDAATALEQKYKYWRSCCFPAEKNTPGLCRAAAAGPAHAILFFFHFFSLLLCRAAAAGQAHAILYFVLISFFSSMQGGCCRTSTHCESITSKSPLCCSPSDRLNKASEVRFFSTSKLDILVPAS